MQGVVHPGSTRLQTMSTTAQAVPRADRLEISLPKGLVISGLVAALYGPVLTQMVIQWWQDPDYGDRFVVPVFVGYVLSQRRHKLRQVSLGTKHFGVSLMVCGVGLL